MTRQYVLPPLPEDMIAQKMTETEVRSLLRRYGERCIEAVRQRRGEPVELPTGWREQFKEAVYDNLAAADNQDVPLEEYPERILKVLGAVVGPRHPTVIMWRNDAIRTCVSIAYKYCRDPESHKYLKQDLEALLTTAPQPATPAQEPSVPEGWKLVPVEPTHIMMYVGVEEWSTRDDSEEDVQGIWEAMLEAAPKFGEEE